MTALKHPTRWVLIVQTAFIGDVILTLPLAQVAARIFGDATIDFLTIPASKNIVETHRDISQLVDLRRQTRQRSRLAKLSGAGETASGDQRYDLAIIPHRSMRSGAGVAGAYSSTNRIPSQRWTNVADRCILPFTAFTKLNGICICSSRSAFRRRWANCRRSIFPKKMWRMSKIGSRHSK
ncbi:MAG: hypothetical protein R3C26_25145 [Calditrichia bacterium]